MPKPTDAQLSRIFTDWFSLFQSGHAGPGMLANTLNDAWKGAWAEAEAERETLRCRHVTRGQIARIVGGLQIPAEDYSAAIDHLLELCRAARSVAEGDEVEQHNRDQRIRREAYETALAEAGDIFRGEPGALAARRYPLRKRVPKVIPDPHGCGRWTVKYSEQCSAAGAVRLNSDGSTSPPTFEVLLLTMERASAIAALLDDPWTWEESTEVEEASDG